MNDFEAYMRPHLQRQDRLDHTLEKRFGKVEMSLRAEHQADCPECEAPAHCGDRHDHCEWYTVRVCMCRCNRCVAALESRDE